MVPHAVVFHVTTIFRINIDALGFSNKLCKFLSIGVWSVNLLAVNNFKLIYNTGY
jgi:hypothetical protein